MIDWAEAHKLLFGMLNAYEDISVQWSLMFLSVSLGPLLWNISLKAPLQNLTGF
jgi:hypothetical protein